MGLVSWLTNCLRVIRNRRSVSHSAGRPVAEAEAEIRSVQAWMFQHGEQAVFQLPPINPADLQVIGALIQLFAFADLNGRRILGMMERLRGEPPTAVNRTPRDSDVLPDVISQIASLALSPAETAETITRLSRIQDLALHRHHLAHWAARRAPNADAIVAMTLNRREASRRTGVILGEFEAQFVVIPMPELRATLPLLQNDVDWLARMVGVWWERHSAVLDA